MNHEITYAQITADVIVSHPRNLADISGELYDAVIGEGSQQVDVMEIRSITHNDLSARKAFFTISDAYHIWAGLKIVQSRVDDPEPIAALLERIERMFSESEWLLYYDSL